MLPESKADPAPASESATAPPPAVTPAITNSNEPPPAATVAHGDPAQEKPPGDSVDAAPDSPPLAQEMDTSLVAAPAKRSTPHGLAAIFMALILLMAQAGYFFRAEISSQMPALAPVIQAYCKSLGCTVQLPRQAELLVLESSGLESVPGVPTVVTLTALLRNSASYSQDLPHLQLTLTNLQGAAIARRQFRPADYMEKKNGSLAGMAAGQKLEIRIRLDIAELKPDGYNLLLFYPR
jgi:hypothetical protein